MAITEIKKGTVIFRSGQKLEHLSIIAKGTVKLINQSRELVLEKGDCLGLIDVISNIHSFHAVTMEDTSIISYPYEKHEDLKKILSSSKDVPIMLVNSIVKQIVELMNHFFLNQFECDNTYEYVKSCNDEYRLLCGRFRMPIKELPDLEEISPLILEEDIDTWVSDFYEGIRDISDPLKQQIYSASPSVTLGMILQASRQIRQIMELNQSMDLYLAELSSLFLNDNEMDYFDLYTSLLYHALKERKEALSLTASVSKLMIQIESMPSISKELYRARVEKHKQQLLQIEKALLEKPSSPGAVQQKKAETANTEALYDSLKTIMKYADLDEETATNFQNSILAYKKLSDKNSQEDSARLLRKSIADQFYNLYREVFMLSHMEQDLPLIIKMFLLFGYVDEELAGYDNALYLAELAKTFKGNPEKGVYTIYEWLLEIFKGNKEPCRNEFDTDYTAYIHEMKVTGKISDLLEQKMLNDKAQKVVFEIQNVFPIVNKITFGRASTFCPVFSEHNVLKNLSSCVVNPDVIEKGETFIRNIDYSAFYRETIFNNPKYKTIKETIHVEVLPDIILTPTIGTRGITWQEIEGKRRTTPARMMLPILNMEDTTQTLIRITGEYRWEMCKRIQGARWNDFSESSLTSEYFDYIQFYRKNNDLSPEAKDKIKLSLQKAKNSFKEMFVRDYITWILYEGTGSPRLNKVARKIMFTYCPFPTALRAQLSKNPLYSDMFDRYSILQKQRIHHLESAIQKINTTGQPIPEEFIKESEFARM